MAAEYTLFTSLTDGSRLCGPTGRTRAERGTATQETASARRRISRLWSATACRRCSCAARISEPTSGTGTSTTRHGRCCRPALPSWPRSTRPTSSTRRTSTATCSGGWAWHDRRRPRCSADAQDVGCRPRTRTRRELELPPRRYCLVLLVLLLAPDALKRRQVGLHVKDATRLRVALDRMTSWSDELRAALHRTASARTLRGILSHKNTSFLPPD